MRGTQAPASQMPSPPRRDKVLRELDVPEAPSGPPYPPTLLPPHLVPHLDRMGSESSTFSAKVREGS